MTGLAGALLVSAAEMPGSRLMSGFCRALVVVGAVFGVALLSAGVASADGPVQMKSRLGDVCLDGPSGNFNAPAVINPCDGSETQRWNFNSPGQIESVAFPGNCLAVDVLSEWPVTLVPCNGGLGQRWSLQPNGQISTVLAGCLNAGFGAPNSGTEVNHLNCGLDGPGEEWDRIP